MKIFKKKDYNRDSNETWLTREQIGFFIFTKENLLEKKYKLRIFDLIKEIETLILPEKFNLLRVGWNKNSFINLTENNFKKFKNDFLKFEYFRQGDARTDKLGYEIDMKKDGGKNTSIGNFRIYIEIDGLINYAPWEHRKGIGCHEISIFVPLNFPKKDKLIEIIKKKFTEFNCVYGYINPIISYNINPIESIWVLNEYTKEKDGIFDVPDNIGNNDYYHNKIKGTQWGTFLTKEHIRQLGGIKKIREEFKDFIVEEVSKDALYIQMSVSLSFDKKILVPQHKRLAKLFKEIYMPKWSGSSTFSGVNEKFLRRFI